MPNSKMFRPVQVGTKKRYTYARSQEVLGMPHLLDLQTKSYEWFCKEGLRDVFADISPIEDSAHKWALHFGEYYFKKEKYSIDECKTRDATYSAPLQVKVQLVNKETGEIKEHDLFMGDFPIMTDTGTFIINGAERVIVSQLVRSPGVYYKKEMDTFGKEIYSAQLIPNRGAWIELETDANGVVSVRIDRNRKMPVTYLIRALGFSSNEEIMELFNNDIHIEETLKKDETQNTKEALIAIYKKLRPGEPATEESGTTLLRNFFYDPRRYDLAKVGRYKLNKKLSWENRLKGHRTEGPIVDTETGEIIIQGNALIDEEAIAILKKSGVFSKVEMVEVMTQKEDGTPVKVICSNGMRDDSYRILDRADIIAAVDYLLNMIQGYGRPDDIDHLGNRRVRLVGELVENQYRIGLVRMERAIKERMSIQEVATLMPHDLINPKPVAAVLKGKVDVKGKNVVCLLSGGNIDVNILNRVITRGLVMSGRKANLTIALEDKPGQLQQVADIVSRCGSNVVSVLHDGSDPNMPISSCFLKLTLETRDNAQIEQIRQELTKAGFQLVAERV